MSTFSPSCNRCSPWVSENIWRLLSSSFALPIPHFQAPREQTGRKAPHIQAKAACHSVFKHQEEVLRFAIWEREIPCMSARSKESRCKKDLHLIPGCPGSHNVPIQETINSRVMKRWDFCPPVVCLVFRRVWKGRSEVAGIEQHEAISSQ
jgi:hypothetical protein